MGIIRAVPRDYLCLRHQQWLSGIHRQPGGRLPQPQPSPLLDPLQDPPAPMTGSACGTGQVCVQLNVPMASVISARTVERAARHGAFKAGKSLHDTGQVAGLPRPISGRGAGSPHGHRARVRVGIRYQFLVGECDCADAAPETTSDDYLQAAASGEQDRPELCAHAVAVALAAIDARLPWASAPAGHRPRYQRVIERITTLAPPFDITTVFPELSALAAATVRLHPRAGRPDIRDSSLGGPLLWPADQPWPVCHATARELGTGPGAGGYHLMGGGRGVGGHARILRPPEHQCLPPGRRARGGRDRPLRTSAVPAGRRAAIYARNVPDLPFPDGTDLFQLLWCPNNHGEPWYGPRRPPSGAARPTSPKCCSDRPSPSSTRTSTQPGTTRCRACCVLSG